MRAYFRLQITLINRTLTEMGSRPVFAYPLGVLLFVGLSVLLFIKTEFAAYIYGVSALSIVLRLSEVKRNTFLQLTFSQADYRTIRILENIIVVFPFVVFLLYKQVFMVSLVLIICTVGLGFLRFKNPFTYTIPTPFGKTPFEFPVGFRKTFYIFPLAYYLAFQSIASGNFNLGLASIILVGLVVLSYYSNPENEYYIWSFNVSPKVFLVQKIKTGVFLFTGLSLPIILGLLVCFTDEASGLLLCTCVCYTYIATVILAKYSAYPYKMNLTEGMLIGMSLMFIPVLIVIIPLLYVKSTKQLNLLLDHD